MSAYTSTLIDSNSYSLMGCGLCDCVGCDEHVSMQCMPTKQCPPQPGTSSVDFTNSLWTGPACVWITLALGQPVCGLHSH